MTEQNGRENPAATIVDIVEKVVENQKKYGITQLAVRADTIMKLDTFLRNHINDEELFMPWLIDGLPDGGDRVDALGIAEDDELYTGALETALDIIMRDLT